MQAQTHNSFTKLTEPYRSCLLYLRQFMLEFSTDISESWSFNTPFYKYRNKSLAFISYHPKTKEIYISFTNGNKIEHPALFSEGRKKMKIFRVDPDKDIDIASLKSILTLATTI